MDTNQNFIEINNYIKKFKKNSIGEISFGINKGEVTALLGTSGSGKSVLINSIIGCNKKYSGVIKINGSNISIKKGYQENKRIGFYTQIDFSLQNISLNNYLKNICLIMGLKKEYIKSQIEYWVNFFGLEDSIEKKVKDFSWGMKNRVNLILTFLKDPEIIILDEPGANLDSYWRNKIKNLLIKFKQEGKTIIITAHNIDEINEIIDNYLVIDSGKLIFSGSKEELNVYNKYKLFLQDRFDNSDFREFLKTKEIKSFKFNESENSIIFATNQLKEINWIFVYFISKSILILNLVKLPINMESVHKAIEDKENKTEEIKK
ncbi:ABC transporter ATP-binding protein [Spiroplasma endosymbiont of Cantharis lateralis]|uniref:ABC transporter ATP-binding protein n=1 Tax=Spiroplasma endosymbiont of Cantharis lateralis TaxID=3066277 RepID=UPI00313CB3A9